MSSKINKWWSSIAPALRHHMHLDLPTLKEAQFEFDKAIPEPLSEEQIESIVKRTKKMLDIRK